MHSGRNIPRTARRTAAPQGRFGGTVVLITGTGDGGIGAAIAARLAEEGATLALTGRQRPDRLMKQLAGLGDRCAWWPMDVTSDKDVAAVVPECAARFGPIGVVVNNAGIEASGALDAMNDAEWSAIIDTNLNGAIKVTRAALPRMRRPGGVIVNVASVLGLGGSAGFSVYSASKAGLIGLTQSLAWELAPRGIRVVCVAPALVRTPMVRRHMGKLTDKSLEQIEACHPLGIGAPQDVAAAVAFLASDDARWITGATLPLGWAPQFPLPA
jgi:NAD(P)-dependent dehydrogenase (short-subunit alcohol dehydrogenase family)